jgi:filamentous hemagglutinin
MSITKTGGGATPPGGTTILSVDSNTQITISGNVNTSSGTQFIGDIGGTSDATANAGGITIKGASDKTFNWYSGTNSWTSSEHLALVSGKTILFNGSTSGTTTVQSSAVSGGILTLSANTGALISTGDTGTVTNVMLNGSIPNTKLANSSVTIGTTNLALGSSNTTIKGLVNIGLANSSNPANTVTLQLDNVGGNNTIIFPNQSGTVVIAGGGGAPISNTMIANNAIANNHISDTAAIATYKLAANTVTIGTTPFVLGASNTAIRGIQNLTFSNTANPANTVSLIVDNVGGNNTIIFPNQSGTVVLSGGGGSGGASITSAMIVDGTIVDGDISATAAIATSKLAANTISGVYLGSNLSSLANTSGVYAGILLSNTSYNGSKTETININEKFVATSNANLAFFSATTGAFMKSVVSSNTGSGNLVFSDGPTLVTPNIGAATGTSLVLSGDLYARNLTLNGNTTILNTNTLSVDDKNITLGDVIAISGVNFNAAAYNGTLTLTSGNTSGMIPGMTITKTEGAGSPGSGCTILSVDSLTQVTVSPVNSGIGAFQASIGAATDITADQGGIRLKGTSDHTIIYSNTALSTAGAWRFSENIDLDSGKSININNTLVANSTHLGTLSGSNITNVTATGLSANSNISTYREKVAGVQIISSNPFYLDVSAANIFQLTFSSEITNPTIYLQHYNVGVNWTRPITIILKQPSTNPGKTMTVNGAKYTDGIAPVLSTTADTIDILTYWSIDNGVTWFGTFAMAGIQP